MLDELFEIEQWGEDAEQAARHARLRADLAAAERYLELLSAPSRSGAGDEMAVDAGGDAGAE